ncbi:hypothetical protein KSP40_PGU011736 [Platanthera guangdongensis]|uniref:Uncharacterized protein n=1 Tax=Platanthera guangdongensis TaxID=2320717 RepID=A0ABR2MBD9_9ASPA
MTWGCHEHLLRNGRRRISRPSIWIDGRHCRHDAAKNGGEGSRARLSARHDAAAGDGMGLGAGPWLLFRGQVPEDRGFEVLFNGGPGVGIRRANIADGPPPAARSLIDSMPTVKIAIGIFTGILIVLCARRSLSWGRRHGRCRASICITPIASFLG